MTTTPLGRKPKCRRCRSTNLRVTSSTQFRQVHGKSREVADVVCDGCGHTWWSIAKGLRALAHIADAKTTRDAERT